MLSIKLSKNSEDGGREWGSKRKKIDRIKKESQRNVGVRQGFVNVRSELALGGESMVAFEFSAAGSG